MMHCDPIRTSALINEIRACAECVRAYGGIDGGRGLVTTTPLKLHLIATHLESEMRTWVHTDQVLAASFSVSATHCGPTLRTRDFLGLRIVPTIIAPRALSTEVQVAELRSTAARITTVDDGLLQALNTSATPHYGKLLTRELNDVLAFAGAIA